MGVPIQNQLHPRDAFPLYNRECVKSPGETSLVVAEFFSNITDPKRRTVRTRYAVRCFGHSRVKHAEAATASGVGPSVCSGRVHRVRDVGGDEEEKKRRLSKQGERTAGNRRALCKRFLPPPPPSPHIFV